MFDAVVVLLQPRFEIRNLVPEHFDHDLGPRLGDDAPGAGEDCELHAFDVDLDEIHRVRNQIVERRRFNHAGYGGHQSARADIVVARTHDVVSCNPI